MSKVDDDEWDSISCFEVEARGLVHPKSPCLTLVVRFTYYGCWLSRQYCMLHTDITYFHIYIMIEKNNNIPDSDAIEALGPAVWQQNLKKEIHLEENLMFHRQAAITLQETFDRYYLNRGLQKLTTQLVLPDVGNPDQDPSYLFCHRSGWLFLTTKITYIRHGRPILLRPKYDW